MRARPSPDLPRRRLLARCLEAHARVVRLIARPGWGKSTFARQLARTYGAYAVVDCSPTDSAGDFERALAGGLEQGADALVIDGAERLEGVPGTIDLLRRAVEEHGERHFVIASRLEIAVGAGRNLSPHDVLSLGAPDLAFDAAEVRELFAGLSVESQLQRVLALTTGWPVATLLFARLAREGCLADALADLNHPSLDDMYAYGARESLPHWTADERAGISAALAIPRATPRDVEEAVGESVRLALEAFASRLSAVKLVEGKFVVGELPAEAVRRFLGDEMRRASEAATRNALASGAFLRAAEIRVAAGDHDGAVDHMERLGRQAPGVSPSPSYNALAKQLPPAALLRSRNVLLAVLADRETQANARPLLAAVERFSSELRRDSDPELIAGNRAALGALLRMTDRPREARVVLEKSLALGDESPERAALMRANLAAALAVAGDIDGAEALLERAGVPAEGPTLFPIERFEVEVARNQLRGDPQGRRAAYERNVDEARFAGPAAHAHALRHAALGAWLDGDDAAASTAIEASNRLVDGALSAERRRLRTSRPRLDGPIERYDRWLCVWYLSAALLEDDPDTARRFAQVALDGFSEIGVPYLDAVAALIAASLSGSDTLALAARARADAAAIGEPALVDAVEAVLAGRYDQAGVLLPVARRIERSRGVRASILRVEVLAGRVVAGTDPLSLRERELELLVVLALERRSLTSQSLVRKLWPDTAADEATAGLRTAVYRLRKQLRDADAVVSTAAGYRLHESIPVDLFEIEQFVAGARAFGVLRDHERSRLGAVLELLSKGLPSIYARWEWFVPYEQRVRDLLHDVGIALAEDDLRRGDTEAAIARAETLLRADLLDEPATEIAIRAHIAAGRKSEAMRRYRRYRDALSREFGVSPGSELAHLIEA